MAELSGNDSCGYTELEDIEMRAELIKQCLQCKSESCPIKTITLKKEDA